MDIGKFDELSLELTKEIMDVLGETVIAFSVFHATQKQNPSTIGAAFLSGLSLLLADLIATGPYTDAEKDKILHSALAMIKQRFSLALGHYNDNRSEESEPIKVIIERNFNRNSEN